IERAVPRDRREAVAGASQWLQQPVWMTALEVALHALGAELAFVERELVPRLEADDFVVMDLQDDPALLAAEAAVRLHLPVDLEVGVPPPWRRLVEVRPVARDELLLAEWKTGHQPKPPTRSDCASVNNRRRQAGHTSCQFPPSASE